MAPRKIDSDNNDSLSDSEDWTKYTDISRRRRIQNRIAQRNRRKKLRSQEQQSKASKSPEASPNQSDLLDVTDWSMAARDTQTLISHIDHTKHQLQDYMSGFSGQQFNDILWDSSSLTPFDESDLSGFDFTTISDVDNGVEITTTTIDPQQDQLFKTTSTLSASDHPTTETDLNGNTALHIAAQNGHLAIVSLLLETGADIDAMNKVGMSALHAAISSRNISTAQFLLEQGADASRISTYGQSCLHLAVKTGDLALVQLIMLYAVDVNVRDHKGETPFHAAVALGYEDIVRAMLTKGINLQAKVGVEDQQQQQQTSFDWSMV